MSSIHGEYPIHKQSRANCGPANLRCLFQYWTGKDYGEEIFSKLTKSNKKEGCSPRKILKAIDKTVFLVEHIYEEGDLEMLNDFIRRGIPPLVCYTDPMYKSDHWATVLGINRMVTLADTVIPKVRKLPKSTFYSSWTLKKKDKNVNNTIIIVPPKKIKRLDNIFISPD